MQIALLAGGLCASPAAFSQEAAPADHSTVRIAYLTQEVEHPPALSNLDEPPADEGLAGARLAVADNNSTGRFLKQGFALEAVTVPIDGDPAQALRDLAAAGHRIVVLDLPGETPGALARLPEAANLLLFNAGSTDDSLRNALCAPNLLHTAPDRAMLADALAQYLAVKRWTKWLLIVGTRPEDRLYAAAVKRSAKRFGAEVVEEKTWSEDHDARRTAQAEMPVFTQGKRHDVVIVADETGDFGDYVLYRTWEPRPVAGTQGLVPTNWHRAHEAWGAAQLQSRFKAAAQRVMSPRDHAVWAAIRAVGEAATRTRSTDPAALAAYIRGPDFTLAAFKGVPLSFRSWDGQLRQPVLLAADRSLVSVSPQDGFLHPKTELDTLGHDQPETGCRR
ncbi:branched-chain amino acid ABC transporter substrate-binding protein [Azospirillum brasilense]|uniref:ABC transporter substrate-binding protein n=1 Tax=Azospirillum brasilense TaxID=192 RepID=A0A4D8QWH3_AZOBR|nr:MULTISPECIES: ABC transporter substrate-binding protein [Azospirillum]MDW7554085.1 ABC transporter substrate-binding protein [Azospirillum brasilense]MDW7592948.1 ABC transporter substrate-binding protein [Azospirillum brasilense]MDW7593656.1 ABC transporter substrate-binding protein [Azospirillum brasilense]MDW7627101.1 ABC transporter substrate-binding protein [Azospirillum brasilense]MDX5953195.1 ABC transporter substrate-binding protein [Azospirillum brasilense]